jgi:hypothetical protein
VNWPGAVESSTPMAHNQATHSRHSRSSAEGLLPLLGPGLEEEEAIFFILDNNKYVLNRQN